MPKSNKAFWQKKFARNVARDHLNEIKIRALGARLLVVWECELAPSRREETLAELLRLIVRPTPEDLDLTCLAAAEPPSEYKA